MKRRYTSSVSPKGQITLPIELRRKYHIDAKDRVAIEDDGDRISVLPEASSLESIYASIPKLQFEYEDGDLERIAKDERVEAFKKKFGPL